MSPAFRTFSFWFCIAGCFVNMVLLFIAKHLHSQSLMKLHLMSLLAFFVGAASHWYLDRLFSKKKR
jgi:hypothetical protein